MARPPTSTIKSIARRISGTSWRRSIIVRAICSPSRKPLRAAGVANAKTVHEFQERYSERLLGLAASQDLLTDRNWRGVPLEALVRAQTARCREKRFVSEGPQVLLNPNATQTLGLALRELCDNALKHGAFSKADGEVSLLWRIDDSEAEPKLEMTGVNAADLA